MSTQAHLYVNNDHVISFSDDHWDPSFLTLFTAHEARLATRTQRERSHLLHDDEGIEQLELVAPATVIRDRLAALGWGSSTADAALIEVIHDARATNKYARAELVDASGELFELLGNELSLLDRLERDGWRPWLERHLSKSSRDAVDDDQVAWRLLRECHPCACLFAIADILSEQTEILLEASELREAGWPVPSPVHADAHGIDWSFWPHGPPIILTEGRTDVEVLRIGLQVVRPHLVGYLRFMEFDMKPEGGAGALVRTVRSFAAAGVSNRLIAIFDNDSAGADAIRGLRQPSLPANISVLQYPSLPSACAYPTIGPTGPVTMDVNGLAGAIELYFGDDVLRDGSEDRRAVQWTGFVQGVNRYQGELLGKHDLLKRYEAKAVRALGDPNARAGQDWSGISAILDAIVAELGRSGASIRSGPSAPRPRDVDAATED